MCAREMEACEMLFGHFFSFMQKIYVLYFQSGGGLHAFLAKIPKNGLSQIGFAANL